MDGAFDVSHAEDCLTQPIRRHVEPPLFVRLASVGADDAHAVDPLDHPVRQLGVGSRDALAQLASALREEPHDARDEEHPERHDECQPPGHQEQQHDVYDDRAGRDDQMDENLQRFARPPGIGREDVQQSSRAIPFDCAEAHGQQLIEDSAAQLMGDPAVHPRKEDAVRVRKGRCGQHDGEQAERDDGLTLVGRNVLEESVHPADQPSASSWRRSSNQPVQQRNEQADPETFRQRLEDAEQDDGGERPLVEPEHRREAPDCARLHHGFSSWHRPLPPRASRWPKMPMRWRYNAVGSHSIVARHGPESQPGRRPIAQGARTEVL